MLPSSIFSSVSGLTFSWINFLIKVASLAYGFSGFLIPDNVHFLESSQIETMRDSEALCLQAFAELLRAPHDEVDAIMKERFPVPRLVICDQHGSQVTISSFSSFLVK